MKLGGVRMLHDWVWSRLENQLEIQLYYNGKPGQPTIVGAAEREVWLVRTFEL